VSEDYQMVIVVVNTVPFDIHHFVFIILLIKSTQPHDNAVGEKNIQLACRALTVALKQDVEYTVTS